MKIYRLAMIGFGNVGQGLVTILRDQGTKLAEQYGAHFQVVAANTLSRGSIYRPDGLEAEQLLATIQDGRRLDSIPAPYHGWDALQTITGSNADVIVETSTTDLTTGEPAMTYVQTALERGRHVVTANKGPVALYYPRLAAIARSRGVALGVEGTVMSGTPALGLARDWLAAAGITRIQGILNGTTNYMLTRMAEGLSYEAALSEAQELGYAEADPAGDVEGYDAAGKVVILANLLTGAALTMEDVDRQGISGLSAADVAAAEAAGEHWKLIGTIERDGTTVQASVRPVRLPFSHPLAGVNGPTNAITYTTELLGDVTLIGPGAGRLETGYALLADLLALHWR
jgi:homoserine dehydrogenase